MPVFDEHLPKAARAFYIYLIAVGLFVTISALFTVIGSIISTCYLDHREDARRAAGRAHLPPFYQQA